MLAGGNVRAVSILPLLSSEKPNPPPEKEPTRMTIAEGIATEVEIEAKTTARFLERFDDSQADFRPHEKSMTAARLASHIVETPIWALSILRADSFDFATSDYQSPEWRTAAEFTEHHERVTADFLNDLRATPDEAFVANWRLLMGEKVIFEGPRVAALRGFIISHLIHHRGQLSVYYRLLGIPVPGAYGPSADDPDPTAAGGGEPNA